jgi:hypothetical protein
MLDRRPAALLSSGSALTTNSTRISFFVPIAPSNADGGFSP